MFGYMLFEIRFFVDKRPQDIGYVHAIMGFTIKLIRMKADDVSLFLHACRTYAGTWNATLRRDISGALYIGLRT
jgi:hypothetical protein